MTMPSLFVFPTKEKKITNKSNFTILVSKTLQCLLAYSFSISSVLFGSSYFGLLFSSSSIPWKIISHPRHSFLFEELRTEANQQSRNQGRFRI